MCIRDRLDTINERITFLYDREHTIGHAFFTKLAHSPDIKTLELIFDKTIIPLLQEYFYEDYQKGQRLEDVADEILVLYGKVKADHSWEEDCFQCYEKVRDRIVFRLINRKANEELLKTIPYVPYLDLAVVFYVLVDVNVHGTCLLYTSRCV